MLFLSLLFFSSFLATASFALGSWSRVNPFAPDTNQLPLSVVTEFPGAEETPHDDTIWGFISKDPRFSKLTKAIQFADDVHHFDDKNANVTFFATPDWALTHHGHHGHCSDLSTFDHMKEEDVAAFAISHRCHWVDVMTAAQDLHGPGLLDDKKERRKKILKLLIHAILAYECMPEALSVYSLGINATYSSKLAIPGIRGGERLRIRVEQNIFPPSTSINFYSKIVESDIQTSNGIVHIVNHPILPPVSAFQTLFLFPQYFSIATSAIQRVDLTDELDLHLHCKDKNVDDCKFGGASSLTFFAPINIAFERLPYKLRLFLFSPVGGRVLKKILQYHIVPDAIVHSDYQYNKSAHIAAKSVEALGHGNTILKRDFHLPTLLNKTVHTRIKKIEYNLPMPGPHKPSIVKTDVIVNGRHALVHDVVTSNAAVHVVDHLLDPRHSEDANADASWEDWEDWLIDWAN
ncbi:hypothetical protein AGABI1DRAFT_68913 [Agaricus bisporus var. burnettii JB137-S8]|uniref:FAS1 domain-containing protein n=1 Tax=Agaricus bisporus var. burnettii (strain JB137-S8 / ATCC MYA-4627 / FGSC 10392) TaxID=597362 RepID=K5W7P7_AGABU|nr:uncharacterized protein AGABI1DRAFT_68913 [Agaricus bisporus var. burnettii JB137-S8]EKM82879.1 hypothetical protein AGABI1DRAFT_68913 [Agaricus bisporus var. burnettii JB137-S8]